MEAAQLRRFWCSPKPGKAFRRGAPGGIQISRRWERFEDDGRGRNRRLAFEAGRRCQVPHCQHGRIRGALRGQIPLHTAARPASRQTESHSNLPKSQRGNGRYAPRASAGRTATSVDRREGSRLQSFPDWFKFAGSEGSQFNQIGNAVPPLLAKALAVAVMECLRSLRSNSGVTAPRKFRQRALFT